MLAGLRRSASSWLIKLLMLLLIVSFGIWGIGDYISSKPTRWVAKIGDEQIMQVEFADAFRQEITEMQSRFGAKIDVEQAREMGLARTSLRQMVDRALLRQAVGASDIVIGDEVVRQMIAADPRFKGLGQRFDRAVFEAVLRNNGYTEARYVAELRQQVALEIILGSINAGIKTAPKAMTDAIYRFRNERRVAEYFILPPAAAGAVTPPSDAVLGEFYKTVAERFTLPETRTVSFAVLSAKDFLGSVAVSDSELRDEYDARRASYETPEKREVQQVVFAKPQDAKAARERILKGESLADIAKGSLGLSETDLNLGKITKDFLPSAIADQVFALKSGELSEPLQSQTGWHLVKVLTIEPMKSRSFEQVKNELQDEIALRRASDLLIDARNRADDILASGATLEELASEFKLPVKKIERVNAQGRDGRGAQAADLPAPANVLTAIFSAAEGAEPALEEAGESGYIAFRVDKIHPEAELPLADVRATVLEMWTMLEQRKIVEQKARDFADRISTGMGMLAAANEAQTKVFQTAAITRTGAEREATLSAVAVENLFRLKPGEAAAAQGLDGAQIVLRLARIEPAEAAQGDERLQPIEQELTKAYANDLLAHYRGHLESQFGVEIDEAALETAF